MSPLDDFENCSKMSLAELWNELANETRTYSNRLRIEMLVNLFNLKTA